MPVVTLSEGTPNEVAIAYLSALNGLGQEYSSRQSGFVFRIKSQFEQFAPVAAKANETSNAVPAFAST